MKNMLQKYMSFVSAETNPHFGHFFEVSGFVGFSKSETPTSRYALLGVTGWDMGIATAFLNGKLRNEKRGD